MYVSQNPRSSRKFAAILALAVLGSLAVSYMVFSNMPAETEFSSETLQAAYAGWKKEHNVTFGGPEDTARFKVFTKTYKDVAESNAKNLTYTLGLNEFSAMTWEEFSEIKLGYNAKALRAATESTVTLPTANLKAGADWTGKLGPVKNQGSCGSCWAFAVIGAVEGLAAIKGNKQTFSEQELVDCSRSYGLGGCGGGNNNRAFDYIRDKGISTQSSYPYKGVDQSCRIPAGNKFKIAGYTAVPANNPAQLKAALNKQPVSVAVQAASPWMNYKSGILSNTACGSALNHAVLAVGYESSGTPYWKVRNSWGSGWGEQGYIRLAITGNDAGICGVQKDPTYPRA